VHELASLPCRRSIGTRHVLPGLKEADLLVLKIACQDRGDGLAVPVSVVVLLAVAALDVVPLPGGEAPGPIDDGGCRKEIDGCDLTNDLDEAGP